MSEEINLNEMNETEKNNAAGDAAIDSAATPPQTAAPEVNLYALNEDEKDFYQSIKDLNEVEIGTLPRSMREEIFAIKEKISAPAAADTEAQATATQDKEENDTAGKEPADAAGTGDGNEKNKSAGDTDHAQMTDAEKIAMLTEEVRKANARYQTLQGKYNAEVRKGKPPQQSTFTTAAGNGSGEENKEDPENNLSDTPEKNNGTGKPQDQSSDTANDEMAKKLAEEFGVDEDFSAFVVKAIEQRLSGQNSRIEDIQTRMLNADLDAAVRNKCGGLGIKEIGEHPLFNRFCTEMADRTSGITAAQAIAEAKSRCDHDAVATIAQQVVNAMRTRGVWDLDGGYPENSGPAEKQSPGNGANTPAQAAADNAGAKTQQFISPHSASGVVLNQQTARNINVVEAELDAALKEFRRTGNGKLAVKIEKLEKEFTSLLTGQNKTT